MHFFRRKSKCSNSRLLLQIGKGFFRISGVSDLQIKWKSLKTWHRICFRKRKLPEYMEKHKLIDNARESRYEYRIGRYRPYIEYRKTAEGGIYLTHTHVPEAIKGQGIATALLEEVLRDIEQQGLLLNPVCPFIRHYIHKHPEWMPITKKEEL